MKAFAEPVAPNRLPEAPLPKAADAKPADTNPEKVAQVKVKPTLLGWFVGQVMKSTGGKANPARVNALLRRALEAEPEKAR